MRFVDECSPGPQALQANQALLAPAPYSGRVGLNAPSTPQPPAPYSGSIGLNSMFSLHSVLRWALTFNISNIEKIHVFDSRIYIQITWYTWFLPA